MAWGAFGKNSPPYRSSWLERQPVAVPVRKQPDPLPSHDYKHPTAGTQKIAQSDQCSTDQPSNSQALSNKTNTWKYCPYCKHNLQAKYVFCPSCSKRVGSIVMAEDLRPKACKSCRGDLNDAFNFCPSCRTVVDEAWMNVPICSNCSCAPPADSDFCPSCGTARSNQALKEDFVRDTRPIRKPRST